MSESLKRKLSVLFDSASGDLHSNRHSTPSKHSRHLGVSLPNTPFRTPLAQQSSTFTPHTSSNIINHNASSTINYSTVESNSAAASTTYSPWSKSEFLKRLQTYTCRTWRESFSSTTTTNETAGDSCMVLTPVDCAKKGWKAIQDPSNTQTISSTLQCVHCNRILNIRIPDADGTSDDQDDDNNMAIRKVLIERYRSDLLVSAHRPSCPWRKKGSDESKVYAISLTRSFIDVLLQRFDQFKNAESQLPEVAQEVLDEAEKQKQELIVHKFYKLLFGSTQSQSSTDTPSKNIDHHSKSLLYTLNGWKLSLPLKSSDLKRTPTTEPSTAPLLLMECDMCFRRVMLSGHHLPSLETTDNEQDKESGINLAQEHQPYCCYVTSWPATILNTSALASRLSEIGPAEKLIEQETTPTKNTTIEDDQSPNLKDLDDGMNSYIAETNERMARLDRLKALYGSSPGRSNRSSPAKLEVSARKALAVKELAPPSTPTRQNRQP